ncbi:MULTISPECIES: tape measure protein [unclassified Pantoea]|uniref:tape measure protein n=1 Tax=unclassified Pantoea TaxID=2630326 RepID=UPI001CC1EB4A|nr:MULTISPECIES: tape measure protein [unclassified Pantoea]
MADANNIVVKTINRTTFEVDKGSYSNTIKKIRSVKSEWEKAGKSIKPLKLDSDLNQSTKMLRQAQQASKATQAQDKAAKAAAKAEKEAAAARVAAERKLNQIRAKSIRFNTSIANANLGGRQRTEALSSFGDLTRQYHGNKLSLQEYNARVAALQSQVRQQGKVGMKGATLPVTAKVEKIDTTLLDRAGGALTIGATIALSGKVLEAGRNFDSALAGLTAITGSAERANQEFAFLQDQANRLGLDLTSTAKDYTQFAASIGQKLPTDQIHQIFSAVSEYGTVLGTTADEQSRAFTALQQMASKGTIMSEELKGQLAEALPGAVGIFVKALNDMKGKTNLTEKDLFALMQSGQLFAKDILPFVGKEMAKTARQGGALDKAINSNRASWQRLQTAMQSSMNEFYKSGFGEATTDLFNTLTAFLNNNADTFRWWGHIAGQVVDGATDAFTGLHNAVVFTARITEFYLKKIGVTGEQMASWGELSAYAIGVTAFAASVWKLGGALKYIIGFMNPLTRLLGVLEGISKLRGLQTDVPSGNTATPKATDAPKPTGGATKWGTAGRLAKIGLLGDIMMAGNVFYDNVLQRGDEKIAENGNQPIPANMPKPVGLLDVLDEWRNANQVSKAVDLNSLATSSNQPNVTFTPPGLSANPVGNPFMTPPAWLNQPLKIDITTKVDDGKVRGLVQQEIKASDQMNFNLLMQGGPG